MPDSCGVVYRNFVADHAWWTSPHILTYWHTWGTLSKRSHLLTERPSIGSSRKLDLRLFTLHQKLTNAGRNILFKSALVGNMLVSRRVPSSFIWWTCSLFPTTDATVVGNFDFHFDICKKCCMSKNNPVGFLSFTFWVYPGFFNFDIGGEQLELPCSFLCSSHFFLKTSAEVTLNGGLVSESPKFST